MSRIAFLFIVALALSLHCCIGLKNTEIDENERTDSLLGASLGGHTARVVELLKKGANPNQIEASVSPLWAACQRGHRDTIFALLEHDADVNFVGLDDWTPLHLVVKWGYADVVLEMVRRKANVNAVESLGWTPLMQASSVGRNDLVEILIEAGADISKKRHSDDATALHLAASSGQGATVRLLLQNKARADAETTIGYTPLFFAAASANGEESTTTLIVLGKADPNRVSNLENGTTPLHVAAQLGHTNVARVLLQHNANVNRTSFDGTSALHAAIHNCSVPTVKLLLEHHADVNKANQKGVRPLFMAVASNTKECAQITLMLCKAGALPNKRNREGLTPLLFATENNHVLHGDALLRGGADVNLPYESDLRTPFIVAVQRQHDEILDLLNDYGVNMNIKDANGNTAMHHAVLGGELELMKFLAAFRIQINARNVQGFTPRDLAANFLKNETVVAVLAVLGGLPGSANFSSVYRGTGLTELTYHSLQGNLEQVEKIVADLYSANEWGEDGATPLMAASDSGFLDVVEYLLGHGAMVNLIERNFGSSAIMYAAEAGHTRVVKRLGEAGAMLDLQDKNGWTAIMRAVNASHQAAAVELLKAGADTSTRGLKNETVVTLAAERDLPALIRIIFQSRNVSKTDVDDSLMIQIHQCRSEAVAFFLSVGASPNGDSCSTPCYPVVAAAKCRLPMVLDALIKSGGDVNTRDERGYSPVHVAILNGNVDALDSLHEAHADFTAKVEVDGVGLSPAELAAKFNKNILVASLNELASGQGAKRDKEL